ncbi:hypothetical protein ACJJTC_014440 [Scirpophaga incertulas]
METPKKRSPNFTSSELEILQKICIKYFKIIENKKSDAVSWQAKQAQWDKIALEFNSQNVTDRCSKVLKKKWENMKKTVKDKVAGHRKHAMGTGGRPPLPDLKMEHWEEEILSHIKLTAVGLPPVFDDDNPDGTQVIEIIGGLDPLSNPVAVEPSAFEDNENQNVVVCDTLKDIPFQEITLKVIEGPAINKEANGSSLTEESQVDRKKTEMSKNWATYSPAMLRSPLTETLREKSSTEVRRYRKRTFNGTTTNKSWTELGEVKKKVANLKVTKLENDIKLQDALLEESRLRSEKLKLKIELLKLELSKKSTQ